MRPINFNRIVGQQKVKERILKRIRSSERRNLPLDHVLLEGPPGLGKTTFAQCIATETGCEFFQAVSHSLSNQSSLVTFLTSTSDHSVVFIDEVHGLPKKVMESLYVVLEDSRLELSPLHHVDLRTRTFVAATTNSGKLTKPFRDRFPIREHLEYYTPQELATIIRQQATKERIVIDGPALDFLASISRGTPRVAINMFSWLRDFVIFQRVSRVKMETVLEAMRQLEIDHLGLTTTDRLLLQTLQQQFKGGPAGVASLSATSGIPTDTIEGEIEPYLLHLGLIARTQRGRVLTEHGRKLLDAKSGGQRQIVLN